MNILEEIAAKTTERIRKEKEAIPLSTLRSAAEKRRAGAPEFLFEKALKKPGVSFICEVKKASPSKGIIAEDFPYLDIAKSYEAAGADAISCLTEPFYFLGRDAYLEEITASVSIPVLRKDFTVDEYMIYQAAAYGASAVLLICSILEDEKLLAYRQLADEPDHRRQQPEPQEFPGGCEQQLKAPLPGPEGLPFRLRKRHQNPL